MRHRAIGPADLDVVHEIFMDGENNPFLDYEPMDRASFRAIFDDLVRQQRTSLVLDDAGDVVGTYAIDRDTHRSSHVATLGSFALHPSHRGRGLGGTVIAEIVERLQQQGIRRLELLVEVDNVRAIRFYEKCSFTSEGVLRKAFRRASDAEDIDDIVMSKLL